MIWKADLHVHSEASPDGRSSLAELARVAKARGLDAVAVCDHNLCTEAPEGLGVLFIPGVELSTDRGHILGLFLDRPVPPLSNADEAVRAIREAGGLAVVAHPFELEKPGPAALEVLDIDGAECANARAAMKNKDANKEALALAARRGLVMTGGSDAHGAGELAACYTKLDAPSLSLPDLKAALAAGKSEPVFVRSCTWREKGLSQFAKAKRYGGAKRKLKAAAYFAGCLARDVFWRKD
jgi:predicted metal-dependent phosphoesterase TrpH